MDFIIKAFQTGGFFMYPIALILIVSTIIIVERMHSVLFRFQTDAAKLMKEVQGHILDNNVDQAIKISNSNKDSVLHTVFKAALINADRPFNEIQEHVEVATLSVLPKLQERLPFLFTFANVATLLGLLGTIVGLVNTFESVALVDASKKQQMLSAGISTAMNTTAFGLIVAIPCMFFYGFIQNKINRIIDDVEHYSSRLLLLLRTGSEFFERFNSEEMISTNQEPVKKEDSDEEMKNAS